MCTVGGAGMDVFATVIHEDAVGERGVCVRHEPSKLRA